MRVQCHVPPLIYSLFSCFSFANYSIWLDGLFILARLFQKWWMGSRSCKLLLQPFLGHPSTPEPNLTQPFDIYTRMSQTLWMKEFERYIENIEMHACIHVGWFNGCMSKWPSLPWYLSSWGFPRCYPNPDYCQSRAAWWCHCGTWSFLFARLMRECLLCRGMDNI